MYNFIYNLHILLKFTFDVSEMLIWLKNELYLANTLPFKLLHVGTTLNLRNRTFSFHHSVITPLVPHSFYFLTL